MKPGQALNIIDMKSDNKLEAVIGQYFWLPSLFEALKAEGLSLPTYQINHLCKFSHGFLLFITYEPVPEAHSIFERFTSLAPC